MYFFNLEKECKQMKISFQWKSLYFIGHRVQIKFLFKLNFIVNLTLRFASKVSKEMLSSNTILSKYQLTVCNFIKIRQKDYKNSKISYKTKKTLIWIADVILIILLIFRACKMTRKNKKKLLFGSPTTSIFSQVLMLKWAIINGLTMEP